MVEGAAVWWIVSFVMISIVFDLAIVFVIGGEVRSDVLGGCLISINFVKIDEVVVEVLFGDALTFVDAVWAVRVA